MHAAHVVRRTCAFLVIALLCVGLAPGAAAADIEISSVSVPSTVRAGTQMYFNVTVQNRGTSDISKALDVTVDVFGQKKTVEDYSVRKSRSVPVPVRVTVPRGTSGPQTAEITATAPGDRDVETVDFSVDPFRMTLTLDPDTATVGERVRIAGVMSTRNSEVRVYVSGQYLTTVTSDNTGHYSTSFTPDEPGTVAVEIEAGSTSVRKFLTVRPQIAVTGIDAPSIANSGEPFQFCTAYVWSGNAAASLQITAGDRTLYTASVTPSTGGRHCTGITLHESGTHTLTVTLQDGGLRARAQHDVRIVDHDVQVSVEPQTFKLDTGQAAVMEISIANDATASRTFDINFAGLKNLTTAPDRKLTLGRGESKSFYIRLVAPADGTFRGNVTVTSGSAISETRSVTVQASTPKSLSGTVLGAIQDKLAALRGSVTQNQYSLIFGVVVLILLGLIGLYWRSHRAVLEPLH